MSTAFGLGIALPIGTQVVFLPATTGTLPPWQGRTLATAMTFADATLEEEGKSRPRRTAGRTRPNRIAPTVRATTSFRKRLRPISFFPLPEGAVVPAMRGQRQGG